MRKQSFRPCVEALEERLSPAASILGVWGSASLSSAPTATLVSGLRVTNQTVPRLEIMPGAQHQLLAQMTLSATGRAQGRLDELMLIPAFESLAQSVNQFMLYADLNGKSKDGCEAIVASARADWQTDVVDFHTFRPLWVRSGRSIKVQVLADFSLSPFGESIGVVTGQAVFKNVRNEVIPDTKVAYRGVGPVQHTVENRVFQVSQMAMAPFGAVFAAQTDVSLLQFAAWSNVDVVAFTTFTTAQGSLDNAGNYRLVHTDWFGNQDAVIQGSAINGQLAFSFFMSSFQGGTWTVKADMKYAADLTDSAVLQLAFVPHGAGIFAAFDLEKSEFMQGFVNNGVGVGQVQFWGQQHYATHYTILSDEPSLTVSLDAGSPMTQSVTGNQTVVAAKYKITGTYDFYTLRRMKFSVSSAAAAVIRQASLWSGSSLLAIVSVDVNGQFTFGLNEFMPPNTSKVLTVKFDLANTASTVNAKVTMTYLEIAYSPNVANTQYLYIEGRDLFVNPPIYG